MLRVLLLLLCLSPAWPGPVFADSEQDEAKSALERGEIKPLDRVLATVRAAVPGDVVAVKLERKKKTWIYELKVLTPAGKRREVKIDAASLAIMDADDDDDD
jgi:uncharacterized membrane protein YkoI